MAPPFSHGARGRCRLGFTFVELMIVMVVLSAIAGVAMVSVSRTAQATRVNRAARLIAGDMQYAFALAASARGPVEIRFDSANVRYAFTRGATDTLFRRAMGPSTLLRLTPGTISFTPAVVSVLPSGVASDTLLVTVSGGGNTTRVWMSRGGTTRIR